MDNDILKVLISEEEIHKIVHRLGKEIEEDYRGKDLVVVGILRGSVVFMTDLIREIDLHLDIDFMDVSSYGDGMESTGIVKILKDLEESIKGRHVLIVEDIVDTGRTVKHLQGLLEYREATSIEVCTFLDKPTRREISGLEVKYVGTEVPNEFVVGYGLDFSQKYRNLPYVGILKPEIYE